MFTGFDDARCVCPVGSSHRANSGEEETRQSERTLFAVGGKNSSNSSSDARATHNVKFFAFDAVRQRLVDVPFTVNSENNQYNSGEDEAVFDLDCCASDELMVACAASTSGATVASVFSFKTQAGGFPKKNEDNNEGEEGEEGKGEVLSVTRGLDVVKEEQRRIVGARVNPKDAKTIAVCFDFGSKVEWHKVREKGEGSEKVGECEVPDDVSLFRKDGMRTNASSKGSWSTSSSSSLYAFTRGGKAYVVDARTNVRTKANASFSQKSRFRDASFSPVGDGKVLITAAEDWLVKTWDLRKATQQHGNGNDQAMLVQCFAGHENVVTKARYNPVYESIAMSSSLDGSVKLWRDSDLSRLPDDEDSGVGSGRKNLADENSEQQKVGVELGSFGNLQTSTVRAFSPVVDACWSTNDPWVCASVTMDGILSTNLVPRSEKYRILL